MPCALLLVLGLAASLNLVPPARVAAPLYWCSWKAQLRGWLEGAGTLSRAEAAAYFANHTSAFAFLNATRDATPACKLPGVGVQPPRLAPVPAAGGGD